MSRDATSSLVDLSRALTVLRPEDEATREAIAALVLGSSAEASLAPSSKGPSPKGQPSFPPPAPVEPPPALRPEPVGRFDVPEAPGGVSLPLVMKRLTGSRSSRPEWLSSAPPLPAPPPPGETAKPPAPLLDPRRSRAILGALAATPGDGAIDEEAIIQSIARGQVLARPPFRPVPTLARGVQLLVDRSDAMLPFLLDVNGLEREFVRLAGGGIEVMQFVACPSRGCGRGVRRRWKPYGPERVPRPGARILCVTDLGLGAAPPGEPAAQPEEWVAFAEGLRRAGCSVGALVPYPPERWPRAVGRVMDLLYWDRTLTVARAAHRVLQRR